MKIDGERFFIDLGLEQRGVVIIRDGDNEDEEIARFSNLNSAIKLYELLTQIAN